MRTISKLFDCCLQTCGGQISKRDGHPTGGDRSTASALTALLLAPALALALGACGGNTTTPPDSAVAGTDDTTDDVNVNVDADDVTIDVNPDSVDGNDSSTTDRCSAATVDKDCKGVLDACQIWTCPKDTCVKANAPENSKCDDGKACNGADKCVAGVCTAGTAPVYGQTNGKDDPCKLCVCDDNPDNTCTVFRSNVGVKCDDDSACTDNDLCAVGQKCLGTPKTCPVSTDLCTLNYCDPKTGGCVSKTDASAEGKNCDDKNACTENETCTAGKCGNGQVPVCDDKNACTTDSCDKDKGCVFLPIEVSAGTPATCDDGDLCTVNDKCLVGGLCKGTDKTLGVSAGACDVPTCDKSSGQVTIGTAANGHPCDDKDVCTKSDKCNNGLCQGVALVCNSGNACLTDSCDPIQGACTSTPKSDGSTCDDGDKCTSGETCVTGNCKGLPTICDDKNACTSDSCIPSTGCVYVPLITAASCDDGNPCTITDKCAGQVCKGTAKDCTDTDPCTSDACDVSPTTGDNCTHKKFDGPCNDGDNCTNTDLCTGGTCAGTKVDCNDGNPCTVDVCDSILKCLHKPVNSGQPCDDGLGCTSNDYCDAGKCTQLPGDNHCKGCNSNGDCSSLNDQDVCNGTIKCIASYKGNVCDTDPATVIKCDGSKDNACTKNSCNPDNGSCSLQYFNAGTLCTGDKCLDNAQCDGLGKCAGVAKDCNDQNECTTDSCDSKVGCKHTSVADGGVCNDGSKCTPNDSCKGGKCVGNTNTCTCSNNNDCTGQDDGNLCNGILTCQPTTTPGLKLCQPDASTVVTCPKLANTCQSNICTPNTGVCNASPKADATACDDNNLCTLGDTCSGGNCQGAQQANCDDKNPCTTDICDTAFGCDHAKLAAGGLCDDGNQCTVNDTCDAGAGICAGKQKDCDDANPCTADACTKASGCTHTIDDTLTCDDGDPCTKPDHCSSGICASTTFPCDDNNSCTIDACDGNGGCKNVVVNGKDCDDGNPCTISDLCTNDVCVGKVKVCDDGNQCTTDSCKNGTCVSTVAAGGACTDNNECTGPDHCTGGGGCIGATIDCSTGTDCKTSLGCSAVTGCTVVNNDGGLCDDGDFCTSGNLPGSKGDKCQGGGCSGPTVDCNDQNICTNDVCDAKVGCIITQNACDDQNSCTVDTCDKVLGCQHENVNGGFCDDNDACTQKTVCDSGTCTGGAATDCDDKNDCTGDSCDTKSGCAHAALDVTATCNDGNFCTDDHCLDGNCLGVPKDCNDNNPCTVDSCNSISGCVHSDALEASDCDDGDGCTVGEKCQGGVCGGGSLTGVIDGHKCEACPGGQDSECFGDNNNLCDGRYRCKPSTAYPNVNTCYWDKTTVTCDSTGDKPCLHNVCNAATGSCETTPSVNATPCEDGKGCTVNDTCYNGNCVSGPANDCASVKDACNAGNCVEDPNSAQGFKCIAMPLDVTVACDSDGNGCTANDHCSAGKCVAGSAVDCTGVAKDCQVGACKSTGANSFTCQTSTAADNTKCDDKQLCTTGDFCKAGKCQAGTGSYDCTAESGVCALGVCDKTSNGGFGACVPTPKNEGQPCDADSNGCTQGDKCVQGSCVPGVAPDCTGSTTDCSTGACKSTGASAFSCVGAPKPDKLPCEADQNGCTVGDACLVGKCTAGKATDCSAQNSADGCQIGTCKSLSNASNTCVVVAATVGTVCNADNTGCTKGDACNVQGACVPGPVVDCNTLTNACATGNCVSTGNQTFTCQGTPKADGTVCDADDDGCTQSDKCTAGKCVAGAKADCGTTTSQCLSKKCTSMGFDKYLCQDIALADLSACDADGNGCTVGDSCFGGSCAAGAAETCAAYQAQCNTASCGSTGTASFTCNVTPTTSYPPLSPAVSCVSTDNPTTCPANYKCVETDATTHAGSCDPIATVSCSDGSSCTQSDFCSNGTCTGSNPTVCDDGNVCTTDTCDPKTGGCVYTPVSGCGKCLNEDFQNGSAETKNMVVRSRVPAAANWVWTTSTTTIDGDYEATWNATTWQDPATKALGTRLLARKLYLGSGGSSVLEFDATITGGDDACTYGSMVVYVNDVAVDIPNGAVTQKVLCNTSGKVHLKVDLSAWAGAPVDISFEAAPGTTKPTNAFTIVLDNIVVSGPCSASCVGVDFEPRGAGYLDTPYVVPQAWQFTQSDATYAFWKTSAAAGHTGSGEMVAGWSGAPTSGTAQVAQVTLPQISINAGNKLNFAIKTSFGDTTCGADDIAVRVAGTTTVTEIYKRCDNTSGWTVQTIDLSTYANSTVDIQFVVTTGANSKAKGTVEIDDVSISGNSGTTGADNSGSCTYLCLSDNFDTGGVGKWTTAVKPTGTTLKAWAASTVWASSGTTSALAQYDTTVADNSLTYMVGTTSKGMEILLPVLGATEIVQYNTFVAGAAADCTTNAASGVFWNRVTPASGGIAPPTTVPTLVADLAEPLAAWHCDTSNGASKKSNTISPKSSTDVNVPSFYVVKQPGTTSSKVYIDDVQIICQ